MPGVAKKLKAGCEQLLDASALADSGVAPCSSHAALRKVEEATVSCLQQVGEPQVRSRAVLARSVPSLPRPSRFHRRPA